MKKIFILCSMAAAMFSCSKFTQEHDGQTVELGGREEVTVSFDFDGLDDFTTKADVTVDESAKVSLEVFAFFDNKLVAHMPRTTSVSTAKLTVVAANLKFCALVNQPALGTSGITTVESLRAKYQSYDEKSANLPMYGEADATVSSQASNVSITLKRNVSRIRVEKITDALSALYASYELQLDALYITNANGVYYLQSPTSVAAYSFKNAGQTITTTDNLYYVPFTSVKLKANPSTSASYSLNRNFYLCPNASASTTKTQLCIDFTFLDKQYKLAHTFSDLGANCKYDIKEIKLVGTGEEISVSMTLTVADWDNVTVGTSGIIELGKVTL